MLRADLDGTTSSHSIFVARAACVIKKKHINSVSSF